MKKQIPKINVIYLLSFFSDALFSPFLALYFSSVGIEEGKKGILIALIPLFCLTGSLFYGKLSGKAKRNLLLIRILIFAQLVVMMLMGFVSDFVCLSALTIVFALHNNTFFSFQDGIAVKISSEEHTVYARTRVFGSVGYLFGTLIGGKFIEWTGYKTVFLIAGLIFVIVEFLYFTIKSGEEEEANSTKITFSQVLANPTFRIYLVFYVLVLGTWSIEEAYVSLFFKSYGVSTAYWGYAFALQIFVEILAMFAVNRKKFSPHWLLLIASALILTRSLILSFAYNHWVKLILNASFRGLAWGIFLSSHMETVKRILPEEEITRAVLIFAVCSNLYVALGDLLAPFVYTNLSFNALYFILSGIQVLGVGVLFFFLKKTGLSEKRSSDL